MTGRARRYVAPEEEIRVLFSILLHGLRAFGPLFVVGVIQRTESGLCGRRGPSLSSSRGTRKATSSGCCSEPHHDVGVLGGPWSGSSSVLALSLLPVGMHPAALSFEATLCSLCALGLDASSRWVRRLIPVRLSRAGWGTRGDPRCVIEPALHRVHGARARNGRRPFTGMLSGGAGVAGMQALP